jgi:hypothetical protein
MNIGEVVRELEVLPADEPPPQVETQPGEPVPDEPAVPANG